MSNNRTKADISVAFTNNAAAYDKIWIIFDTAATANRPAYYRDVHETLAAPRGAILRYNYRQSYLSRSAIGLMEASRATPTLVKRPALLVYAQDPQYIRFSPYDWKDGAVIRFLATRLAWVTSAVESNREYLMDLELRDYPLQSPATNAAFDDLLQRLQRDGETPGKAWVTVASARQLWEALSGNVQSELEQDRRWQSIVDVLGSPPMQFAGDLFYRVRGVYADPITPFRSRQRVQPRILSRAGDSVAESQYVVSEGVGVSIEIFSTTPEVERTFKLAAENRVGSIVPGSSASFITATVDSQGHMKLVSSPRVRLRPHGIQAVELRVSRSDEVAYRVSAISFEAAGHQAPQAEWPAGAVVTLQFRIRKDVRVIMSTAIFLIFGIVLTVLATSTPSEQASLKGLYTGMAAALAVLATLFGAGKLPVRT